MASPAQSPTRARLIEQYEIRNPKPETRALSASLNGLANSKPALPVTPALTPTLSLGEREDCFSRGAKSKRSEAAERPARGLPLPKGGGRGEGEESVRPSRSALLEFGLPNSAFGLPSAIGYRLSAISPRYLAA